jgi:hypothetical protein
MADEVEEPEVNPVPPEPVVLDPEIQAMLDEIEAEQAQEEATKAADEAAQQEKVDRLLAAKAICAAVCAPIEDALAVTTDPRKRQALIELEHRKHAEHEDILREAVFNFTGEREGNIVQAQPGVNNIAMHAVVAGEVESAPEAS